MIPICSRQWCVVVLVALAARIVTGQVLMSSSLGGTETHAWAVYRNAHEEVLLVHLPPRNPSTDDRLAIRPGVLGEIRPVRRLEAFPDGLAASDEKVFVIFDPVLVGERWVRRVYSGRAVASPVGGVWSFDPPDRLEPEPSLFLKAQVVDFLALGDTLWALMNEDDAGEHTQSVWKVDGSSWIQVPLPEHAQGPLVGLIHTGDQVLAISQAEENQLRAHRYGDAQQQWIEDWSTLKTNTKSNTKPILVSGTHGLSVIEPGENGQSVLHLWTRSGDYVISQGAYPVADSAYAELGSVNHLVAITRNPSPDTDTSQPSEVLATIQVAEYDLSTGEELYAGDPVVVPPVSGEEVRFLMGMLILVMVGGLVAVLMPDRTDSMGIPVGFALSEPSRRVVASMFDLMLIATLLGMVFNVRLFEVLSLSVIIRQDNSWLIYPSMMVGGMVIGTLSEWLFGASFGKWVTGLRVVKAQAGPMERISFRSSLVRNLIKWLLPPVGLLMTVDPEGLHRGDRATRTIVVYLVDPTDSGDHEDSAS